MGSFLAMNGVDLLSYAMGPYGDILQWGKVLFAFYGLYHSYSAALDGEKHFNVEDTEKEVLQNRPSLQNCLGICGNIMKDLSS